MKKIILGVIIVAASALTSCKKTELVKPVLAPVQTLAGFKKDISSAD